MHSIERHLPDMAIVGHSPADCPKIGGRRSVICAH
jgi:hypothetical protein